MKVKRVKYGKGGEELKQNEIRKLVIITGVTQGLGRVMVERFHELGWNICGCGRSKDKIEELKNITVIHMIFKSLMSQILSKLVVGQAMYFINIGPRFVNK